MLLIFDAAREPFGGEGVVDENPYQSPNAAPQAEPRSIIRLALSGVSFIGAVFLAFIADKAVAISVAIGRGSTSTGFRSVTLLLLPWACINVASFGLVSVGMFRKRQRMTLVGGCVLGLSTLILFVAPFMLG